MSRYTFLTISSLGIFGLLAAYVYNHYMDLPLPKSATSIVPSNIPPLSSMSGSTPAAIIVGSGLAGLSAASELISHSIPVHVLERAARPGGNSMKASSGINGAPTKHQAVSNDDLFFSDTVKSAGKAMRSFTQQREKLIGTLTNESVKAIGWLEEKGVDLSKVARLGGHSVGRTHRGRGNLPPGAAIMTTLLKGLGGSQLFHLHTNCTVTKVLQDEESAGGKRRVKGVQYTRSSPDGSTTEALELHGPVIFASGGFAGDAQGLLAQYRPDLAGYPSTNEARPGTQPLLTPLGVQLVDMDQVQVHPTGFIDPANPASSVKFLAAEVLRGAGGILLRKGERFVNELDTRERVTAAIIQGEAREGVEGAPRMWDIQLVLDSGVYESAKSHIDFYIFKGLIKKTTIGELPYGAKSLEAIKRYAAFASGDSEDAFNRPTAAEWSLRDPTMESVVFVGDVTPVIHFTMGGALIDADAQVLGKSEGDGTSEVGEPIQGLWAAGEVAGGVHGANRLGGSSLLECVVFGRRAGRGVVKYIRGLGAE